MKRKISISWLAVIGLSACASGYQVSDGAETALVTFEKGYLDGLGFGRSTSQQYNTPTHSDGCNDPELLANFTWTGPPSKTKEIEAGKLITIAALTIDYDVSAGANQIVTEQSVACSSRVTFLPVSGETYRMKLVESTEGTCRLEFVNTQTNTVPENAKVEDKYSCLVP